jgi:Na+/H+ antiporter NhaD/arsenite permease-like protein
MIKNFFSKKMVLVAILMFVVVSVFGQTIASTFSFQSLGIDTLLFILFGMILLGIAFMHKQAFYFSVFGALTILIFKEWMDPGFHLFGHLFGENSFILQLTDKSTRQGEWPVLINLFGLLLGFAILAKIFEESGIPAVIPKYLPSSWVGPFILLVLIFVLSSFLDNIAAALIGGTIALVVFKKKVHIGFVAAIVAASNAGGSGSVVGDTTTTMMWIDGVGALNVLHGFIAAGIALLFFAWFASHQQDKYQPLVKPETEEKTEIKWLNLLAVFTILVGAIIANVLYDMPALGVWGAILLAALYIKVPWEELKHNMKGTIFLLGLIFSASLMPVNELPSASWVTAFVLGGVSAFFDNIPLTKICLEQGHYDWGMLAYSVGFGGSMIWFGSSAGVAITNKFHEARNMVKWVKGAWHVIIAYVIGFFMLYLIMGWEPADNNKHKIKDCPVVGCPFSQADKK